jgi:hypothetical protein
MMVIIKTATYPAVYYVSGGKKYLFVNRVTFGTWRADFSGLKVVSQADFDSVNLGGNVTARPGVSLVKFDNSANVYAVLQAPFWLSWLMPPLRLPFMAALLRSSSSLLSKQTTPNRLPS